MEKPRGCFLLSFRTTSLGQQKKHQDMESGGQQAPKTKKRHAKHLPHAPKRKKEMDLAPGLSGFFITCGVTKVPQASREAVSLLDEFHGRLLKANRMLGNEAEDRPQTDPEHAQFSEESKAPDEEADRVEADIAKAEASICSIPNLPEKENNDVQDPKKATFAAMDTGCGGVVFIRILAEGDEDTSKCPNPNELVDAIMHDAIASNTPLTRYCMKVLPAEITCHASPDELKKAAERIILHHFPEGETSYKYEVVYAARANSDVNRRQFVDTVANLIPKPHCVDVKNPDKTIIIQVVKTICTIGVVQNYKEYFKYNLRRIPFEMHQASEANIE